MDSPQFMHPIFPHFEFKLKIHCTSNTNITQLITKWSVEHVMYKAVKARNTLQKK